METTDLQSITGGPMKPHEYVLVKRKLKAGDTRFIQNRGAKMRPDLNNPKNPEIVLMQGDAQFAMLLRAIKGWNLTETIQVGEKEVERPVPFIQEKLEQQLEDMDQDLYTYLLEQVNELYAPKEASESNANFQLAVVDSSEGNLNQEKVYRLNH